MGEVVHLSLLYPKIRTLVQSAFFAATVLLWPIGASAGCAETAAEDCSSGGFIKCDSGDDLCKKICIKKRTLACNEAVLATKGKDATNSSLAGKSPSGSQNPKGKADSPAPGPSSKVGGETPASGTTTGGGQTSPTSGQGGSYGDAGNTALGASRDKQGLQRDVRQGINDIGEIRRQAAAEALREAERRRREELAKQARGPVKSSTANDLNLAKQASQSLDGGNVFTLRDAKKASDPAVRRNLLTAAVAEETIEEFKEKDKKLDFDIAQLMKIAATAFGRTQSLNSLSADGKAAVPGVSHQTPDASLQTVSAPNESRDLASGDSDASVSELFLEDSEQTSVDPSGVASDEGADPEKVKKFKKIATSALRQAIQAKYAKLLKERQLQEQLAASQFEGKLTPDQIDGSPSLSRRDVKDVNSTSAHQAGAFEAAASALNGASAEQQFTMRGSETDAEVKQFMEEGSRELASTFHAPGVLEVDSPSLFERVRAAHKSCLKRRCIRL